MSRHSLAQQKQMLGKLLYGERLPIVRERDEKHVASFRRILTRHLLLLAGMGAVGWVAGRFDWGEPRWWKTALAVAAIVIWLVLLIANWRCPRCGISLDRFVGTSDCSHCGATLR